jgi:hypothetical protein
VNREKLYYPGARQDIYIYCDNFALQKPDKTTTTKPYPLLPYGKTMPELVIKPDAINEGLRYLEHRDPGSLLFDGIVDHVEARNFVALVVGRAMPGQLHHALSTDSFEEGEYYRVTAWNSGGQPRISKYKPVGQAKADFLREKEGAKVASTGKVKRLQILLERYS